MQTLGKSYKQTWVQPQDVLKPNTITLEHSHTQDKPQRVSTSTPQEKLRMPECDQVH
jgi:hypothetical protein